MSDQIPYIRVFISSPGDVNAERQITLEVIDRLPYRPAFRDKVAFRVIAWDKPGADTPMRATLTPQDAINRGLPKPAECDIVVVLFWSRMGTPFTDNDGKAYQSGTHWELLNAIESKRSETVIYRRTDKPAFEFTDADFDAKRAQYQRVQDFFNSAMFYQNGQIQRGVNGYSTPDDFREKFETHFEALVVNLLDKIAAGKPAPENLPPPTVAQQANIITIEKRAWTAGKSPFPGLVPFTAEDAPIFFGRGQETDALVKQVLKSRFVAVVGASGSGKSSLVGAGLVPQLRANVIEGSKDWIIARFTPGNEPFTALANALIDHVPALHVADPMDYPAKLKKLVSNLQDDPDFLPLMLTHALKGEKAWAEVVLFIDQFEELFTVGAAQAQAFARVMQKVAASERLRTLVTIRADFAHEAIAIPEFSELFRDGFFALAIPRRDALRQMIERPAERAGLTVDTGLVERMLDDTGNEPGNLALLAYMLDELYRLCAVDGQLTQAAYDALGGVQGAIGKRSESVYTGLDEAAKNALPTVFRELVEVDERGTATRRRALLARVTGDAATKALVETLTRARLLVQNTDHDGNPVVEVAHEALLRNWERLTTWITDSRDDLSLLRQVRNAAGEWERKGKLNFYLWSHERLVPVYEMFNRLDPHIDEIMQEFTLPESKRLLNELEVIDTSHQRRAQIGERLAAIGDPRSGVGLDKNGLPDIEWCMVSDSLQEYPFLMAKYPITYLQYKVFVDYDNGYSNDKWWDGLGRETSHGLQNTPINNAPADNVSWYDATAYCRWLSQQSDFMSHIYKKFNLNHSTYCVRLMTMREYLFVIKHRYTWGDEWDNRYANTGSSGLMRTVAVGMYPASTSHEGVADLIGNVSVWCVKDDDSTAEELRKPVSGGNWYFGSQLAQRGSIMHFYPSDRTNTIGMRLVYAPYLD
jgi:hypothetical protein